MRNFLALAFLVLLASCGSEGQRPCTAKDEVKGVLTGVKQGCSGSGLISAALAANTDEANDFINNTFSGSHDGIDQVSAIRNNKFYTIVHFDGKFYANIGTNSEIKQLQNGNFYLTYDFQDEDGNIIRPSHMTGPFELEFNFDDDGNILTFVNGVFQASLDKDNSPYPNAELEDIEIINELN